MLDTRSAMADAAVPPASTPLRRTRINWRLRTSLTARILAVNIIALGLMAGSLFYLDSYRNQLLAERFQLASAEADFARYERLRQQNFISQAEFERRQAAVLAARAEHEAKLDGLGLITSRALVGGVVQRVAVSKGQRVEAGAVLVVLSGSASPVAPPLSGADQRIQVPLSAVINGGQAVMLIEPIEGGHRVRQQLASSYNAP